MFSFYFPNLLTVLAYLKLCQEKIAEVQRTYHIKPLWVVVCLYALQSDSSMAYCTLQVIISSFSESKTESGYISGFAV